MNNFADSSLNDVPAPDDITSFIENLNIKDCNTDDLLDPLENLTDTLDDVRDHMDERRELCERLETDPKLKKNFIAAQKEILEEMVETESDESGMEEARAIAKRIYKRTSGIKENKNTETINDNDEIDFSKYGSVSDLESSEDDNHEYCDKIKNRKHTNGIYIRKAYKPTFILNF